MWQTKRGVIGSISMALLFVIYSSLTLAQSSSSILGRVEDASGATLPEANVTITSLETGAARTIVADESGHYQVLSLPVGPYEVKAEKAGFKTEVKTGINLVVGQQAVVDLRLEVGTVQERVTVTGEAALVNTTTSSVAGLVGETQVKDLPLNGRSFDLLITLNPGTSNYSFAKQPSAKNGGNFFFGGNMFSVDGRRPAENLTLLNGVQYSGSGIGVNTPGGASTQLLGVDAVREYNVVSDGYGVEYGQRAGAQVSMVTQSGTNQIHGTLFEFLRNSDLDARNFFDQTIGAPPFERNQYGGALGLPIRKDKTFFFGNYEGFRQRLGLSAVTFVPDLNARQGLLPCGSSGITCASGAPVGTPTKVPNLNFGMLVYMPEWPSPNGPNLGGGVAEAFTNPKETLAEDFGTGRFDQLFSTKDSLSAVYTISDGTDVVPTTDPFFGNLITIVNQVVSLQETHILSPQAVNTFTAGFTRGNYVTNPSVLNATFPASLSFVPGDPPGQITVGGALGGSVLNTAGLAGGLNQYRRNLFTYSDGLQVIKGKHQISAGVWFQRMQQNDYAAINGLGSASFPNFPSFLQGNLSSLAVGVHPDTFGWRSWEGAWYLQDSVQLRPNLTVRFGLRDEFSNGWSEVHGKAQTSIFENGVLQTLPRTSDNLLTQNNSKLLLSPRIGLAWDPFGNGKTSVRAAAGIYYSLVDWLPQYVSVAPPLAGSVTFTDIPPAILPLFSLVPVNESTIALPPCAPGLVSGVTCNMFASRGLQSDFQVPTIQSWNFTVEQQLTRDTAFRVAYVGSHNYHNWATIDPNSIPPQICSSPAGCTSGGGGVAKGTVPQGAQYFPVGTRPNPFLSGGLFAATDSYGHYNALQTEVIRRLTKGLQFRANYTWSKNLDVASASNQQISVNEGSAVNNPYDPSQDYGRAAFDARHQAAGNLSYALPFGQGKAWLNSAHGLVDKLVSGWQFNGIVTLSSGVPFDLLLGTTTTGDTGYGAANRPNWNPTFTGNVITGTPTHWFNPAAFQIPTPGTLGNVARDAIQGPGLADVDLSLFKGTKISERTQLQFRAEVFNVLNRANFGFPSNTVFSGTSINPNAGVITATNTTSRQIQFGMKLVF